jgi:serine/threonine protein kinase
VLNLEGYDQRCDLFSLGGIIYFLLSQKECHLCHISCQHKLDQLKDDIPLNHEKSSLIPIMMNLLNVDPKERMSIEEIVEKLEGDMEILKRHSIVLNFKNEENRSPVPLENIKEYVEKSPEKILRLNLKDRHQGTSHHSKKLYIDYFQYCTKEYLNNEEFMLKAAKINVDSLKYASDELKSNKQFIMKAIEINEKSATFASPELIKHDKDIALIILKGDTFGQKFKHFSLKLQHDKDFIIEAIKHCRIVRESFIPIYLQYDKEFVKELVIKTGASSIRYFPDSIRNDKELLIQLVEISKSTLQYSKWNESKEFVESLIDKNPEFVLYISSRLKNDFKFILKIVKKNIICFNYVDSRLRSDKNLIKEIIQEYPIATEFISKKLKNDSSFALELVSINGECLKYLPMNLRDNITIVKEAVSNHPEISEFASKRIKYLGSSEKYQTVKKIGEGGEGVIYLVKQNDAFFAEKRIMVESISDLNLVLSRFSQIILLQHSNIFTIIEIIQDQNNIIDTTLIRIVMELYDENLSEFLKRQIDLIPEKQMIDFAIQMVKGLDYLHSNNIIHADIKPENIFLKNLENEIILKIGDFGFNESKNYEFYGSLVYVAPEIIVDHSKHNEKSDVFSLGGILYTMMKNKEEVLYLKSLKNEIKMDGKYNEKFVGLVLGMLDSNPGNRMNTKEILKILHEINKN